MEKTLLEPSLGRDSKNTLTRDTSQKGTPNGGATAPVEIGIEEARTLPTTNVRDTDESWEKQNPNPSCESVNIGENPNPQELVTKAEVVENPNPTPENAKEDSYTDDIMRVDLTGVPPIMVQTARYWCFRTGRRVLTAKEVEALQWCEATQMPTYVNKCIDKAIAIWTKQGKLVCQQHFTYIKAMLEHQKTFDPAKKRAKHNKKASQSEVQTQPVEKPVVELAMPLEAAEKVIAEYKPASKSSAGLPAALGELLEGIKAKDAELTEERIAALPKDANGLEILPDDKAGLEALHRGIDLPDYLRLKFPNATEAELSTDKLSLDAKTALVTAMEIDKACAYCDTPEECRLPAGSQPGHGRPVAILTNGKVGVGRNHCLKCKHSCASSQPDPDFERRVKECGLTEVQAKRDFASYSHESPEVVVAKARAILAAQNGTNLVLAGSVGAGKTHLATAIALEAVRMGRKAIVANVPEMLEEICHAAQNFRDIFGMLMKYKSVDCLVLDDWGKERTSGARLDYMYQIINYRYEHGLQTIVTTNAVTPDGLKDKFNADKIGPMVSRILSNGEWVTIQDAGDYRLKPKEAEPDEAPILAPVQTAPVSEPDQVAPVAEPVQEVPIVESNVSPAMNEEAEVPAEKATESDEKAPEGEVVSDAGVSTPEPLTASVQSETPAPAVVSEPSSETPSESDEKGLESEAVDGTGANTPDEAISPQSDEDDPCVDGDIFDWETGQVYSQEYLDSWEAEIRELEEQSREEPDLPDEDERRWSS